MVIVLLFFPPFCFIVLMSAFCPSSIFFVLFCILSLFHLYCFNLFSLFVLVLSFLSMCSLRNLSRVPPCLLLGSALEVFQRLRDVSTFETKFALRLIRARIQHSGANRHNSCNIIFGGIRWLSKRCFYNLPERIARDANRITRNKP